MFKMLFKNWLIESYFCEMATLNFGGSKGHRGKDHTEAPTHYLNWMQQQIAKDEKGNPIGGDSGFNVSDRGRRLGNRELSDILNKELARRNNSVQSQQTQPQQTQPQQTQPQQNKMVQKSLIKNEWVWAKSLIARPEYEIPAPNLNLAMKQYDENNWMFVILDVEEGRLVSRGKIPTVDIKNVVKREMKDGEIVKGSKPSDILEAITPKKEKGDKKMIPDNHITAEQKAIEEKFEKMLSSPEQNHMMISALAGSGKTTALKHLAWKFGKGKKWLYLVFGTRNKEEAKSEFPPSIQVETTNGFAGREVLGKNHIKPTDRVQEFSFSEKSKMVADGAGFAKYVISLGIPNQNQEYGSDPKSMSGTDKSLWYALRSINSEFKTEAVKLLGLAKSFAVDPRRTDLDSKLQSVMDQYDLNTDLEDSKERLTKNTPWAITYINKLMGKEFLTHDFADEMKKATIWLLEQVMPHVSQEEFTADAGNQKGTTQKLGTKRDFDDDLWFSAIHANELKWPKYEVVLADEVQDFNVCQKIILQKLAENGAKIVAVGDENQCHPAGTMIALTGGGSKPIEEIQVGDEVVTYNTKKSFFPGTNTQGRRILEKAVRPYNGEMINIVADGFRLKCTSNHKCLVKFDNAGRNKFAIYLMVKNGNARVGMCRLNYTNGFGLALRSHAEDADRSYLLNVFDTEREARIAEVVASYKFGIPQLMFKNNGKNAADQNFINEVYEKIGDNLSNAKLCVESFGRIWEYPIWSKEKKEKFGKLSQNYIGSRKPFITQACNLVSEYMLVRTFDGTNRGGRWTKAKIEKELAKCDVYSLSVEPTEGGRRLYIADNMVIGNSIYRFRGADNNAFSDLGEMLKNMSHEKDVTHSLTANFRSRQAVIDMANDEGAESGHVSNLVKGRPFKEEPGRIGKGQATKDEVTYDQSFDTLQSEFNDMGEIKQTAYLSRTNEPLVHASLNLMSSGIPFVILGKDIAANLNKHIDKIINLFKLKNDSSVMELQSKINEYNDEQKEAHSGKVAMSGKIKDLKEVTEAMSAAIEQFDKERDGSVYDFRRWLSEKFGGIDVEGKKGQDELKKKVEELNPVILSTIHKSKGFQFQRVYILRDDMWPHPRASRPADLSQEMNNKYIGRTRAEDELHVLTLKGQPGYVDRSEGK